jgi:hypothetical protein
MTKALKEAIEGLLKYDTPEFQGALRKAYEESRENMTETSKRIEFLEECLETGVSKREAARMLVRSDPRIGQKTAETLVYFNFSGQYITTRRGQRRYGAVAEVEIPMIPAPPAIDDDESIL